MIGKVFCFTIDFKNRLATQELINSIDGLVNNFWVLINDNDPVDYTASQTTINTYRIGYNAGFSSACNHAILLCKEEECQYLFQVNNDAKIISKPSLDIFFSNFGKNESLAIASPLIKKQNGGVEYAGSHWISNLGLAVIHAKKNIPKDTPCIYSSFINGACFIARVSALDEVGGFDPDYFAYREEHDLALRLKRKDYKLACLPCLAVEHNLSQTSNRYLDFKSFLLFRGQYLFSLKNYSLPARYSFTIYLIIKQALKALSSIKRPKTVKGILSAARLCIIKNKESYTIENESITFYPSGKWENSSSKKHSPLKTRHNYVYRELLQTVQTQQP